MTNEAPVETRQTPPKNMVELLEVYLNHLRVGSAIVPVQVGVLVGFAAGVFGLLTAWSTLPLPFTTGPLPFWLSGATGITAVLLVLAVYSFDFYVLGLTYHFIRVDAFAELEQERETAFTGERALEPDEPEATAAEITNWLGFLQSRVESLTSVVSALVALAGLIPLTAALQAVPQIHSSLITAVGAGVLAGVVSGIAASAYLRAVRHRDGVMLLQTFVLGHQLTRSDRIMLAFLKSASEDDRVKGKLVLGTPDPPGGGKAPRANQSHR